MCKRICSLLLIAALLAGVLCLPGILPATAATVTGGTVTAVTDKAQVAALGTSLVKGKTAYSYDYWDGTRQPENAPVLKSANIMGQSSGVWESAAAHTVLTDGDFYLKNELSFATVVGAAGDTYYNENIGACLVANPYQVSNSKTPLYAKTTAYQRFARYWASTDSHRMYYDIGSEAIISDILVASGVNPSYLEVAIAATLTADQLAEKAATYDANTFLKDVKVYISSDLDTLYDDANMAFYFNESTNVDMWGWANVYHLASAQRGRYVGFRFGPNGTSHRAIAELGVYGDIPRDMDNGTTPTVVERVTDRAQVEALGESLVSDLAWNSYAYWDGTSATKELRHANRIPENQGVWENGNAHEVVTDGDYYLPGELKFDTDGGELVGNAYQLANNKTPVYAQSTAYERFVRYWPSPDSYRMFYSLGADTMISDIFVASGVNLSYVELATAKAMSAEELAAAEATYDQNSFAKQIKVFISSDLDTLYNDANMAFYFNETLDVEKWAWANIYHLEEAQRGRYIGFQFGTAAASAYRYIAEVGVYGNGMPTENLGAQLRGDYSADAKTAALRFGFELPCTGVTRNDTTYERVLTADSTVQIGRKTYPLVDMGAVVARGDLYVDKELTVELVSSAGGAAANVQALKLYEVAENSVTFTAVVVGVPNAYFNTSVRARPYVVYQDGEEEKYLYGSTIKRSVATSCEGSDPIMLDNTKKAILNDLADVENAINTAAEQTGDYVELTDYAHLATDGIWTTALQTALNENEYVHIPGSVEKYMVDKTVTIPSNRHILADDDAIICLTADCEVLMLRNEHNVDGTLTKPDQSNRDENIFIQGGIWMEARGKRAGYGASGRYDNNWVKGNYYGVSTCMLFNNVENVRLKDMTFVQTSGFAVQAGELSNAVFENITFDNCFADGLHINGNTENIVVRHVRGETYDDLVALNMYDWQNSSVTFGPMRNVLVEDVVAPSSNSSNAMRILPGTYYFQDGTSVDCAAENIIVRQLRGIKKFKMFFQTPSYTIGSTPEAGAVGSGKNIFFEDIDVNLDSPTHWFASATGSDPLRNSFGAFEINANIENIHFEDIRFTHYAETYPMSYLIHVGPVSSVNGTTEILDPYLSSTVSKITWDNITVNTEPIDDLTPYVYTSAFDNINNDGMSTGKGEIGKISKLYP